MSSLAGIIGAGISAAASIVGTHMKNEGQKRESELAYRREQAAIREQNAYNSASAQMARLQAAGLNPNMMYERSQEAVAGTQSDIPRYQPAEIDNAVAPLGNAGAQMISNIVSLREMENKTALANSQILVNSSTREFNLENTRFTKSSADRVLALLGWEIKEKEVGVEYSRQRIQEIKKNMDLTDANIAKLKKDLQLSDAQISNLDAETKQILLLAPEKVAWYKADTAQRKAMVEKIALGMNLARQDNWRGWISLGVSSVADIAGIIAKFKFGGQSLNGVFGENPWSKNLTPGSDLIGPDNDFVDFLNGD